jgi:vacuolar-type H+-ATPase subunit H
MGRSDKDVICAGIRHLRYCSYIEGVTMKEIVERILKEEAAARRQVGDAKLEAERMSVAAKLEAETILREALVVAKESSRQKIDKAEQDFLAQKAEILAVAGTEGQRLSASLKDKVSGIAEEIFRKYAF